MTDMELAEEIERKAAIGDGHVALTDEKWQQIIAALRRGPEPDQTYIVDGKGMRLCDCPNESKCQRGFQRTLATTEFSRCLLPIDHRRFNWFRSSFEKRPPSGEMVMVPRELIARAVLWFHTFAENGMDATFSDGERTPNAVAMDEIAAQFSTLSAAEASKEAK